MNNKKPKKSVFGGFFGFRSENETLNLEDYPLSQWSTQMVVMWLKTQGHDKKVYKIFEKNKINGTFFCQNVTKADIVRLGFTPGMAITLHNQIEKLIERMKTINPYNVVLSSRPHYNTSKRASSNLSTSSESMSQLVTPPRALGGSISSTSGACSLISQSSPGFAEHQIPIFVQHQRKFSVLTDKYMMDSEEASSSSLSDQNVSSSNATTSSSLTNNGGITISEVEVEDDYFLKMEMESFTVQDKAEEDKELQEYLAETLIMNEVTALDLSSNQSSSSQPSSPSGSLISDTNSTATSTAANTSSPCTMPSSSSNLTTSSSAASNKYLLVPVAPYSTLPDEYFSAYQSCLSNVNLLPFQVHNLQSIVQDLIIPERFIFKYFNIKHYMPDDDDDDTAQSSNTQSSSSKNAVRSMKKTFLKIQFVFNALDRGVWFKMQKQYKTQLKGFKPHKFGVFYPALLIGPFLVEYTHHGIALVRISKSKRVVGHEITTITGADKVKEVLQKVSQVCCEFNGSRKFDIQKNNPMHFVYAVLDKLKMRKQCENHLSKGCVKSYIQNLERFGYYSMTINLPKQIATLIGKEEYIVDSHKDLDELHINIQTNFPDYFNDEGKTDETLLQSFDIAFWYWHFENKSFEDFRPAYSSKICSCPFNMLEKHPIDMIESASKTSYRGPSYHIAQVLPPRPSDSPTSASSPNTTE
ncbi:hypothetical protein FDP41_011477 [Naegleria fowleri]|uniref:SAM domain-containing protein n=1 Tax=Naegleria fowleri TaxID=5763 RepID=A0A6A5BZ45_NAEFO|nr:uncharacterized protein FDP41_011477 [Naegleria fowleri]KAF0982547.1 hypothetical protein FDP41_011477 [Naegleria fowleri]